MRWWPMSIAGPVAALPMFAASVGPTQIEDKTGAVYFIGSPDTIPIWSPLVSKFLEARQ
jgi:hypothetical protein